MLVFLMMLQLAASTALAQEDCEKFHSSLQDQVSRVLTVRDAFGHRRARPLPKEGGLDALEKRHLASSMAIMLCEKVLNRCNKATYRSEAEEILVAIRKPDTCLDGALSPYPGEKLTRPIAISRYAECMRKGLDSAEALHVALGEEGKSAKSAPQPKRASSH